MPHRLRDGCRVAGFVLADLEEEKVVDGADCFHGCAGYFDISALVGFVKLISNFLGEAFHFGHTGRSLIVHEHRNIKFALGEGVRDVREVFADLFAGDRVFFVVRSDGNEAAIGFEQEVMVGRRLGEAHALFAARRHGFVVGMMGFGVFMWAFARLPWPRMKR